MTLSSRTVDYSAGDNTFVGYMVWDDAHPDPRPGVLVAHAWGGCSELEKNAAHRLAERGYVGFAIDMYGGGRTGCSAEENAGLMQPLLDDRGELLTRITLALETCSGQAEVDASRLAAVGFCFGGLCVLDLARSGARLAAVVSFHGLFMPPESGCNPPVRASILALHGYDDPMVPPESMVALGAELTEAEADWQIHAYGGTQHAFTNPGAHDPVLGTIYNETASTRAFQAAWNFLEERLGV